MLRGEEAEKIVLKSLLAWTQPRWMEPDLTLGISPSLQPQSWEERSNSHGSQALGCWDGWEVALGWVWDGWG